MCLTSCVITVISCVCCCLAFRSRSSCFEKAIEKKVHRTRVLPTSNLLLLSKMQIPHAAAPVRKKCASSNETYSQIKETTPLPTNVSHCRLQWGLEPGTAATTRRESFGILVGPGSVQVAKKSRCRSAPPRDNPRRDGGGTYLFAPSCAYGAARRGVQPL